MIQQVEQRRAAHHPAWLVFLRVPLGLCLFIKGISFFYDAQALPEMLHNINFLGTGSLGWLALVITWAHLIGGVLMVIGLFTRWAAALQIPILLGAVLFVNLRRGFFQPGSELFFSIAILLFLVFFFIEGGGPLSVDEYARKYLL